MASDLVFLDCETLGLHPDAPIWEFAAIRRSPDGSFNSLHIFIDHEPQPWLDKLPERFLTDYQRRYTPEAATRQPTAAVLIDRITRGAHVVGMVPSFDTERLAKLLRRNNIEPDWHYQLIDVEAMISGYLRVVPPPWDSNKLSNTIGVDPAKFERHTAMGDVAWVMAIYDKLGSDELTSI